MKQKADRKNTVASKKHKATIVQEIDLDKLFDQMLGGLYKDTVSIRRRKEVGQETLSIRFGSDN